MVFKRSVHGSAALLDGGLLEQLPFKVEEVDPVGAGDAFDSGYLAAYQ